jgi:hypothetical protein
MPAEIGAAEVRLPYEVVYKSHSQAVPIVAVAHGKRKPGHWRQR